jgi:hypothetical protein
MGQMQPQGGMMGSMTEQQRGQMMVQRFEAANTTHDGCLTLTQAQDADDREEFYRDRHQQQRLCHHGRDQNLARSA